MPANGNLTGNSVVDLYNRIEIECGKAERKLGKHLSEESVAAYDLPFDVRE